MLSKHRVRLTRACLAVCKNRRIEAANHFAYAVYTDQFRQLESALYSTF